MLAKIYIEALLVDEELADQVFEVCEAGEIDDAIACIAWMMIAGRSGGVDLIRQEDRTDAASC